jgi:hypothetical protein
MSAIITLTRPREVTLWAIPLLLLVPAFVRIPSFTGPDLTPQRAVLLACVVSVFIAIPSGQRLPTRFFVAACAFGVYTAASALLHGGRLPEINKALSYTVESALPVFLVVRVVRHRADAERLLNRVVAVMTAASLLAIWERVTGHFLFGAHALFFHAPARSGHIRVQGVFPHPLVLGVAIAIVAPLAVRRIVQNDQRGMNVAAIAAMLAALYLTQGRGPAAAMIVGLLVFAAVQRGGTRIGITAVTISAVLVFAFSPVGATTLTKAIENPTAENGGYTVDYRQHLLTQTFHWVNRHPFGAGPGQTASLQLYAQVGEQGVSDLAVSIDDAYARYALELGWPGLVLFGLMLSALVAETRLLAHDSLRAALLGSQAAMLVASLTVATFTWAQILLLFWSLAGVALALRAQEN